jgi:hypothetical protein
MRIRALALAAASVAILSPSFAAEAQKSLQGTKLSLRNVVATVEFKFTPGVQGTQVSLSGDQKMIDRVTYAEENGTAVIAMKPDEAYITIGPSEESLRMTVTVAPGTPLEIDNLVGSATGGDLDAPLTIDGSASGDISLGRVAIASIDIGGSTDVTLGAVNGSLDLDISGSGDLRVASAASTAISVSGSGDTDIGSVAGILGIDISGSGDVTVGEVSGATEIDSSGSGDVTIARGQASPFAASTSGSGDIQFGGTASNPQIFSSGSGGVCVAKVDGQISIDGENIEISATACIGS